MPLGSPDFSSELHAIPFSAGGYELYFFESLLVDLDGQIPIVTPRPSPRHILPISPYIKHVIGRLSDGKQLVF